MEAAAILEKQFEALKQHDYLEKLRAGELDTEQKRKKLLDAYAEEISVTRLEWQNIQVSVVAGARNTRFLRLVERAIPKLAA
ncbi:recombinase [Agrobacterium tumefaciens str. Cherry 2E-2-2]|nr:recombinase [Agrobacterium tumefaciens str. Cherry 2E-2-2]